MPTYPVGQLDSLGHVTREGIALEQSSGKEPKGTINVGSTPTQSLSSSTLSTETMSQEPERLRLRGPRRDIFVYVSIFATALLVIGMIAILCFNWLDNPEPITIVLRGDASVDGMILNIEGVSLRHVHSYTLSAANDYSTKVYLKPGRYQIFIDSSAPQKRWLTVADEPLLVDVAALARETHATRP